MIGGAPDEEEPAETAGGAGGLAAAAAVALLGLLAGASAVPGQEAPDEPEDEPLVTAPEHFWIGPTAGFVGWESPAADGQTVEDVPMAGLEIGTRVSRYLGFRFSAEFGQPDLTGVDSLGVRRGAESNQWLLEVSLQPRLAVGPWAEVGVVPYGTVGAGGLVHDPRGLPGDVRLLTRSQGFLMFGGGLTVEPPALQPFGFRAEWREMDVQLQPMFRPRVQEGDTRSAGGVRAGVYFVF